MTTFQALAIGFAIGCIYCMLLDNVRKRRRRFEAARRVERSMAEVVKATRAWLALGSK